MSFDYVKAFFFGFLMFLVRNKGMRKTRRKQLAECNVTASSGTAISTDFATLT